MANIKLGAIITDIAGSVGGSTFRRTPAGIILYNKQGTQIKSAFAQASQKNAISNIFRGWDTLTLNQRNQWAENALLYPVKNKFGETKYLTGRQLYTKLNTQLLPTNTVSDVQDFNLVVEDRSVSVLDFNSETETLNLDWGGNNLEYYLLVSMYRVRDHGSVKPHAHYKRIYVAPHIGNGQADLWKKFSRNFPLYSQGNWYGFNIQWMNASGIITSVQSFTHKLF